MMPDTHIAYSLNILHIHVHVFIRGQCIVLKTFVQSIPVCPEACRGGRTKIVMNVASSNLRAWLKVPKFYR